MVRVRVRRRLRVRVKFMVTRKYQLLAMGWVWVRTER